MPSFRSMGAAVAWRAMVALALLGFQCACGRTEGSGEPSVATWYQELALAVNTDPYSSWSASMEHITEEHGQLYKMRQHIEQGAQLQREKRAPLGRHHRPQKATLDYRQSGVLLHPKHQGSCGSCWAFAAVHAITDRISLDRHATVPRASPAPPSSIQHVLECACPRQGSDCGRDGDGCQGAQLHVASRFMKYNGSPPQTCKPYTGSDKGCRKRCNDGRYVTAHHLTKIHSYRSVVTSRRRPLSRRIADMRSALARGPLIAQIRTYTGMPLHKRGIYKPRSFEKFRGYHAVEIVGYGRQVERSRRGRARSVPYWIVKNSWGDQFADSGYLNVEMGTAAAMEQVVIEPLLRPLTAAESRNNRDSYGTRTWRGRRAVTPSSGSMGAVTCSRRTITPTDANLPEYQQAVLFLNSVVRRQYEQRFLAGCTMNSRFLNGSHQLVESYVYYLTVQYSVKECPQPNLVYTGAVALQYRSGLYSLVRGTLQSLTWVKGCPCGSHSTTNVTAEHARNSAPAPSNN
ncbi:cathepsin B-like cysteine proteinase 2 [Sycon ciliatum]|uniref:cathepsin B-like cysteine proteinase 2 n=1 Tax=Sycon ciliatum TaxID=27933 RepID=UPI0031F69B7F